MKILRKVTASDVVNWLILFILLVQVILLGTLSQRITTLVNLFSAAKPVALVLDRIPDEQGHSLGSPNAPVTLVEFADFQCPYCAAAEPTIKRIISQYPDKVRFVLTTIHPYAMRAAEASECASAQGKFWEMHDLIFTRQSDFEKSGFLGEEFFMRLAQEINLDSSAFENCLSGQTVDEYINKDISDGLKYGVHGTPSFFVNKHEVSDVSSLENIILNVLRSTSN